MPNLRLHGFCSALVALVLLAACSGSGSGSAAVFPPPRAGTTGATSVAQPVQALGVGPGQAVAGVQSAVSKPLAGVGGFSGLRAFFEHSLICDNGVLIANYAAQYHIATIFVPVAGDDITSLLAENSTTVKNLKAMTAVANVYFISGDPTWLSSPATLPADAASLAKIAAIYPKVAGILYDVSPEKSAQWNTGQRQSVIRAYFTLVQTLLAQPNASAFNQTLFAADDDWGVIRDGGPSGPTLLTHIQHQSGVTGIVLNAPGDSASAQLANIGPDLPLMTKPFWTEANTSPYVPHSYNGISAALLQWNLFNVQQTVSVQNANWIGNLADGWTDLYNSLQSILPQPPVFSGVLASGPLAPPAGSIYLGASINPNANPGGNTPGETAFIESRIGRKLAYNIHFYGWGVSFPGSNESNDVANGRIPMIAWDCDHPNAQVAAGRWDKEIYDHAHSLKAFGKPVFLRWFWEMNLDDLNNGKVSNQRQDCWDPATDLPGGYFSPGNYIAAWRHIHDVFAKVGAANVIWVWCVANAHGGPSQYYPGDDVVDWVGTDNYDTNDLTMANTFFVQLEELSQFQQKPLIIVETGAHPSNQVTFFNDAATVLQTQFPFVRGIGYLDAAGSYQDWVLSNPAGVDAFAAFARSPYMSAMGPDIAGTAIPVTDAESH